VRVYRDSFHDGRSSIDSCNSSIDKSYGGSGFDENCGGKIFFVGTNSSFPRSHPHHKGPADYYGWFLNQEQIPCGGNRPVFLLVLGVLRCWWNSSIHAYSYCILALAICMVLVVLVVAGCDMKSSLAKQERQSAQLF
jgi:hypothetical protein